MSSQVSRRCQTSSAAQPPEGPVMNMLSSSRLALRKRMRRTKGFMERRFLKFLHDAKRGRPGNDVAYIMNKA
jgi:hypothetical protein